MSKAKESKHNQPNIVAKLMGLERLSRGEPNLDMERNHRRKYYSHQMFGHLEEDSFVDKEIMLHHDEEVHNSHNSKEKMALIHQKFMEAKSMSIDERMRGSKQFEDALEVLSSNSDLLMRLLDSQSLYGIHSTPQNETKFITLLKPLKMVVGNEKSDGKGKNKNKKKIDRVIKNPENVDEFPVQSTRIVVLKPSGSFYQRNEDDDVLESTKSAAKEITHERDDETFHSDWSWFNKDGNFSDLEAGSPLQTHSWDHTINHSGESLYSTTLSLGGATCSPESQVCIEAKKRLHQRWTMMESNSKCHQLEEMHLVREKGLTLGEMLSLSPIKKPLSLNHSFNEEEMSIHGSNSSSVPASSSLYEIRVKVEVCDHDDAGKKSKRMRSLFKGKVSSFLFSRSKKSTKEKSIVLSQHKFESQFGVTETFEECSIPSPLGKSSSDSVSNRQQGATIALEPGLIVSKPEIASENQDQPSPISVLDPPFEDDNHESLDCMKSGHRGSLVPLKSNLIDKSPLIESIARTLSWDDDSCAHVSSSLDTKLVEQEWLLFVEKLVSAAGLDDDDGDDQLQWHSLESPLDPSLRDKYANLNDNHLHEAKRRKMRSNHKLVFDFVNAAILEVTEEKKKKECLSRRTKCGGTHTWVLPVQEGRGCPLLVDHIAGQMKELIMAGGVRCDLGDCGDSSSTNSLVVENVVRKEVAGIGWVELMGLEIDILGREIEEDLIQELVESDVVDFTGRA